MGATEGSLSYTTFFVEGEPPSGFQDDYLERISKLAFEPLTALDEDDRRMGWVCLDRPLDTRFQRQDVFYMPYLCLSLRIDKWAIPSTVLRAYLDEALRDHMAERGVDKLGRAEKENVKTLVVSRLKKQLVPTMKIVDMIWHLDAKIVRFWTHSGSLCQEFQELFDETFGFDLVPNGPYTAAVDLGLENDALEQFVELSPEWIIAPS